MPAAQGRPDIAAKQPDAVKGKKKKKRKHSEDEATDAVLESHAQPPSTAAMPAVEASLAAPVLEAAPGQAAGKAPVEVASKPKKTKKQKHREAASALRQSAATPPAPTPEAATAAAAADEAVVADAKDPAASQAEPGIKTKKKKKRKHSQAADQATHSAPSASEAAPADAGLSSAAEASTAQHDADALASEPALAVKPKKRKLKHKGAQAQQAAAAPSSTHLNAASTSPTAADAASEPSKQIAAAVHGSGHSGEPAPTVKRKSKSESLDAVPSADAGVPSAEEATAEAAGQPAARKAPARQSKAASPADKTSISASALQSSSWRENAKRQDVKKGKFTKQEKDTLKQAAVAYAQEHNLPTTDFAWLFCTRSLSSEYKGQATGAWRSISESLPHRTNKAVYACGTRMLHERNYQVSAPAAMLLCCGFASLHWQPLYQQSRWSAKWPACCFYTIPALSMTYWPCSCLQSLQCNTCLNAASVNMFQVFCIGGKQGIHS